MLLHSEATGDELLSCFMKMFEFSTDECFVEISEILVEMIKYLANEPSAGLYYIQQHAQKAVPNIIDRKNDLSDMLHQITLQTEDLEDSIHMLGSIKEYGSPIADEMIAEIKKTLELTSNKEPIRGFIHPSNLVRSLNSTFQLGKAGFWGGLSAWGHGANVQDDVERTENYFSSAVMSAKRKTGNLKWTQLDFKTRGGMVTSLPDLRLLASGRATVLNVQYEEPSKSSGNTAVGMGDDYMLPDSKLQSHHRPSASDKEFKADRGPRLEE